jgi:uncharacterized protein
VITEESSPQLTPLSEERAEPPNPNFGAELQPPPAPESTARAPWLGVVRAVLIWIMSVFLLLFVPVIVALPYIIYKWVNSGPISPEELASDKMLIFLSVLGILPTHLLTLVLTWVILRAGGLRPFWKSVGFEWPQNMSRTMATFLSLLIAVVLLAVAWLATTLYGGAETQLDLLVKSSLPARFATAFVAVFTAPLVEELIYRGVLYPAIEKAAGVGVAIGVVSLLFAGVHVFQYINNIAVITVITLLSFTLTAARAVTGKVLPSFIMHLVFNGIQSLILVLAPFIEKT